MFEDFSIESMHRTYHVSFTACCPALESLYKEGDIVIVDENILNLYPPLESLLSNMSVVAVQANEQSKEYGPIGNVIEKILATGFSKNNRLIAVGGGVTQDITAFISSILFRGVEWIFFPTNLLSQCDSCIGSKTSVNFGNYKNQLGGFWPPSHIYIDFEFLETLAESEINSGIGEMLHYFLVDGSERIEQLEHDISSALTVTETLRRLVYESLSIKKKMVEVDELDKGPRNVFNYGHSFGHALESVTEHAVPHGIAVSFGMDLANVLSARQGLIDMTLRNEIRPILERVWSKTILPIINIDDYLLALSKDKKNIGGEIKVILTSGLGAMFKTTLSPTPEIIEFIDTYFRLQLYRENL